MSRFEQIAGEMVVLPNLKKHNKHLILGNIALLNIITVTTLPQIVLEKCQMVHIILVILLTFYILSL